MKTFIHEVIFIPFRQQDLPLLRRSIPLRFSPLCNQYELIPRDPDSGRRKVGVQRLLFLHERSAIYYQVLKPVL